MQIINYPHPTLRHVSKPLRRVDAEFHALIRRMFELMYEQKGVGLAANQVDLPYRVFIANVTADPELKENEIVMINPVLSGPKGSAEAEEGCLSIPGVYGDVKRAEQITINAFNLQGEEIAAKAEGLLARVMQHEVDHLDGKLFVDRLTTTGQMAVREALEELEIEFRGKREHGEFPSDEEIAARLTELEELRT